MQSDSHLLLSGGLRSSGGTTSGGGTTGSGSRSGTTTGTDGGEDALDVFTVEGLGEEGSPDRLNLNLGGGGQGGDLVTGDFNTLVGQN